MNQSMDELTVRLVGLALAFLLMAGMVISTGLAAKAPQAHAAAVAAQQSYVVAEDTPRN